MSQSIAPLTNDESAQPKEFERAAARCAESGGADRNCGTKKPAKPALPDDVSELRGQRLVGIDLRTAQLAGVDLSECDLSQADLRGANLMNARLERAILCGARLEGAELLGANLSAANLAEVRGEKAGFARANLSGASLFSAQLSHTSFAEADLSGADLRTARLDGARLCSAKLSRADFSRADLAGADLENCQVESAQFLESDLRASRLRNLRGYLSASFLRADIRDVDFGGAYLVRRQMMDENYLHEFRSQSSASNLLYWVWWATSDCGRSLLRWSAWIFLLTFAFGFFYGHVAIDYGSHPTALSPYYFSLVTLTTLGYGDVLPASWPAQTLVMLEVLLGYLGLGGLLSIFSNKMARRAD